MTKTMKYKRRGLSNEWIFLFDLMDPESSFCCVVNQQIKFLHRGRADIIYGVNSKWGKTNNQTKRLSWGGLNSDLSRLRIQFHFFPVKITNSKLKDEF